MNEASNTSDNYLIRAEAVSVILNNTLILNDVNFTLQPNQWIYIIGKTGTGKSTFLKTIYGEIKPSSGELEVLGHDMKKLRFSHIPALRRKMGMVFQDFQLLTDRNVIENLLFVMRATGWKNKVEMMQRAEELLLKIKLENKRLLMPHQLSGGEQQRVCLARALVNQPSLILADEPTGNLDPETATEIMQLLWSVHREGIAVIMVTHNYKLIEKYPAPTYQLREGSLSVIYEG